MPTYTAIAFDRFLETGASKPIDKPAPTSMPVPKVQKLERTTSAPPVKNKVPRPRLKPALYTTPEVKQLPVVDSPSSFPPSPYIINHKRRGPRLHKSSSEASVLSKKNVSSDEKVDDKSFDTCAASSAGDLQFSFTNPEPVEKELLNGVCGGEFDRSNGSELMNGHKEPENSSFANGLIRENGPALNTARDTDIEDFFDPQDSMSFTSNTDVEENAGTDLSMKFSSPGGEFYDAWEGKLDYLHSNFSVANARGSSAFVIMGTSQFFMDISILLHISYSYTDSIGEQERVATSVMEFHRYISCHILPYSFLLFL